MNPIKPIACELCEKADRPIGECPAGSTIGAGSGG